MSLRPIPDGLVVLTFDDGSRSDLEFVAPMLREHQFSATFFVNRGGGAPERQRDYLDSAESFLETLEPAGAGWARAD